MECINSKPLLSGGVGVGLHQSVVTAAHKAVFKDMRERSQSFASLTNDRQMADFDIALDSLGEEESCILLAKKLSQPHITIDYTVSVLSRINLDQQRMVVNNLSPDKIKELLAYYRQKMEIRKKADFEAVRDLASDAIETYCDIILLSDSIGNYVQKYYERIKNSRLFLTNQYEFKYKKFGWNLLDLRKKLQEYVLYLDSNRLMPRMTQYMSHYSEQYFGNGTYTFYAQQKWQKNNTVEAPLYEKCTEAIKSLGANDEETDIWSCLLMVRCMIEVCLHSIMDFNEKALKYNRKLREQWDDDVVTHTHLGLPIPKQPAYGRGIRMELFNDILKNCDRLLTIRFTAGYFDKVMPIIEAGYKAYSTAVKDYKTIFTYLNPVIDDVVRDYAYYFFTMAMLDIRNGNGVPEDVKNDVRYLHQRMDVYTPLRKDLRQLNTLMPSNKDIEDMTDITRDLLTQQPEKFPFLVRTIELLFLLRSDADTFPYNEEFLKKFNELGLMKTILI